MTEISRRTLCLGVLASALTPPFPAFASDGLALPEGLMSLTRRIERPLSGDARIVIERSWNILFARQGSGIAVSGDQSSVSVEAPPALASLAEIERTRSTEAMFPILLSERGAIVAAGNDLLQEDLAKAVRMAERLIDQRKLAADAKAEQLRGLALLQQSAGGVLEEIPRDLFFPVSDPVRAQQAVDLGSGLKGEFELTYEAIRAPGRAWLERAERSVITRIGDSEMRARDIWTMAPI